MVRREATRPRRGQPTKPASADSAPAIPSYHAARDSSGNGEGWWRQRSAWRAFENLAR